MSRPKSNGNSPGNILSALTAAIGLDACGVSERAARFYPVCTAGLFWSCVDLREVPSNLPVQMFFRRLERENTLT